MFGNIYLSLSLDNSQGPRVISQNLFPIDSIYFVMVVKLNDGPTVQFRLKFDLTLFIYMNHSLNSYQYLRSYFSIDVNGDVAQKWSKIFKPLQL